MLMALTVAGSATGPVVAELFLLSTGQLDGDLLTEHIFQGLPRFSLWRVGPANRLHFSTCFLPQEESTLSCHLEKERSVLQVGFLNHDLLFLSTC